jgi:hypothetical protein
MRVEL